MHDVIEIAESKPYSILFDETLEFLRDVHTPNVMNTICPLNQRLPDIAEKIWKLGQRAYQVEARLIGIDEFPPLDRSAKDIQRSCSQYFGIWEGTELLAAVEIEGAEEEFLISSFFVIPSRFRSGLGDMLLHAILETKPNSRFMVETSVWNKPAINLYKKHGFVTTSQREISGGHKIFTMRLRWATSG